MRCLIVGLVAIAAFLPALGRGQEFSNPGHSEVCTALSLLTQGIAEESDRLNVPARETPQYEKLYAELGEVTNTMAHFSDAVRGRVEPSLVAAWSSYGYCHELDEELLIGNSATHVGLACNSAPKGNEHQCVENFLKETLNTVSPDARDRAYQDAEAQGYR
ncbi:MAG: hypothetical protein ACTIJY_09565 [Luteimonas sp.]